MAAKYVIKKTATGYTFALQATNGQNIGVSQVYKTLKNAQLGVESVRKVGSTAPVEDTTASEVVEQKNPKFVIYNDKKGEFRFRLQANNGQNILASEGYTTLKACQNGVASVAKNSVTEIVVLPEEGEEEAPAKKAPAKKAPAKKAAPVAEEAPAEAPEAPVQEEAALIEEAPVVEEAPIQEEAAPVQEEAPKAKKAKKVTAQAAPKAKKAKKTAKSERKADGTFAKPTFKDFEVILRPIITEKTMTLMQEQNKITLEVRADANKTEVKLAFERIYKVKVVAVKISNVKAKITTRGTRYKGKISGYKKAIVTVADGAAIDLFKE